MKKIIILFTLCILSFAINAQTKKKVIAKKQNTKVATSKKTKTVSKPVEVVQPKVDLSNYPNAILLKSGIIYQPIVKGTGTIKAKIDDNVTMHIRAYVSDSMLFDSYKLNNNEPVPAKVIKPQYNGDIMEILSMMVVGDSAVIRVSQDSLFRNGMVPPFAKKGDYVTYQIKMTSIKPKEEFEREMKIATEKSLAIDDAKIVDYIKKSNLKDVKRTPSGLYYQVVKEGNGEKPKVGTEVQMNYTGYLIDGNIFDSNIMEKFKHVALFTFPVGQGKVIKGWDEGVLLMSKQSKYKFIIPSALAYGAQSRPGLPANSVLIFDVELVTF